MEAAIACNEESEHQAYWIDAVCVPPAGRGRRASLESMGFIYSRAESVIVVLKTDSFSAVLASMQSREPLSDAAMTHLDKDKWITSVWTYQEVVNARAVSFTSFEMEVASKISALDLFSQVGWSLRRWKHRHSVPQAAVTTTFPGLNALEDTCADWQTADYVERSMLTCLTGLSGRWCDPARPTNRLYALLGTLSQEPSWGAADETVPQLTEKALQICDIKGDFSYIFTANPRAAHPRWRPETAEGLIPILSWHSLGFSQPGRLTGHHLELDDMVALEFSPLPSIQAIERAAEWVHGFYGTPKDLLSTAQSITRCLPEMLRLIGWTGSEHCATCSTGFVLLQEEMPKSEFVEAFASVAIRWTFGSPGIARIKSNVGPDAYVPLVFVGDLPSREVSRSIVLKG